MQLPLKITVRSVALSEAAKEEIREKSELLNKYYDRIIRCEVIVDAPHRHRSKGLLYEVRINITAPDTELIIKRETNEDLYVAIRDAFDAARRHLEDLAHRQRREIKRHEPPPQGRVVQLFPEEGYGFLEAPDGREIYFHRNSVLNGGFKQLTIGSEVRFSEEEGEKGPQASTVTSIGK